MVLPTIDYLNERKCPIYRHKVPYDSSVYNNYGQKLATPRRSVEMKKVTAQNSSKFVLDKLEETYWATWKPKKENLPVKKKSPRKFSDTGFPDSKPQLKSHNKGNKKSSNKPHGDVSDNIFKYFKAEEFESSTASVVPEKGVKKPDDSSTSVSATNENTDKNKSKKRLIRPRRFFKVNETDSVSQEIQTVVHCPVILEQITKNQEFQIIFENDEAIDDENLESSGDKEDSNKVNKKESKTRKQEEKKDKEEGRNKTEEKVKKILKSKKAKKSFHEAKQSLEETQNNVDKVQPFVEIKDSIDIAKEKQMKSPKEHYQQPKCIRLYRKPGGTSSFIKGGTYPLKSCLKKDTFPKGNFRLGAPGSPLFVTTSSFSSKRKK